VLICDWGRAGTVKAPAGPRPLAFFCSVLGYSRHRQLTFVCLERLPALAVGLASDLEQLGGVPRKVLFDHPEDGTLRDVVGVTVLNLELVQAGRPLLLPAAKRRRVCVSNATEDESAGPVENQLSHPAWTGLWARTDPASGAKPPSLPQLSRKAALKSRAWCRCRTV
jgi:hypothetical protein